MNSGFSARPPPHADAAAHFTAVPSPRPAYRHRPGIHSIGLWHEVVMASIEPMLMLLLLLLLFTIGRCMNCAQNRFLLFNISENFIHSLCYTIARHTARLLLAGSRAVHKYGAAGTQAIEIGFGGNRCGDAAINAQTDVSNFPLLPPSPRCSPLPPARPPAS